MENLNLSLLNKIVENLKEKIVNNFISSITVINSTDVLFSFSFYRKERLLISLQHQNPFISLVNLTESISTTSNSLSDYLRREINGAYITNIEILNNDRVVKFELQKKTEFFELEKKDLIIKLIPTQPNLIILKNGLVEFAKKYLSISSSRPIIKGLNYPQLENRLTLQTNTEISLSQFKEEAISYLNDSYHKRFKENHDALFRFIKSKVKSLTRKIPVLESEISNARNNLIYQEYGTMILSLAGDVDELKTYISLNNIKYDNTVSPGQNANLCFKKYKKAKRAIEMGNEELNKAKFELDKFEYLNNIVKLMNEDELYELEEDLIPKKIVKKKLHKSKIPSFCTEFGTIYYGKSAIQNEEITFKFAKKDDTYLHIKDYYGSHLLIKKEELNDQLMLLACELSLILSNKEAGDIMYTEIKNVKKGSALGQANLLNYKTVTLKNIRESTKKLFSK